MFVLRNPILYGHHLTPRDCRNPALGSASVQPLESFSFSYTSRLNTHTTDEPKIGGRGPDALPPAGGSGGNNDDNWEQRPPGRRGPRERLNRYRTGLGFALGSIYMLFIALTVAYLIRQGGGKMDTATGRIISDWRTLVLPGILWLNTILLVLSSLTIEMARRENFREAWVMEEWLGLGKPTRRASLPWLSLTLLLGLGFLIGQYSAWRELMTQGVYFASNPSSSFFFVLTGAHALHLFGGMVALVWAALATYLARPLESRQIATDISAWYWHAMGLLWIYILAVLHLAK